MAWHAMPEESANPIPTPKNMHCLEVIHSINNRRHIIRDNFNRDSSFVESRSGFVIHSGIHRSTAFISKAEHADAWHAANYWLRQEKAAINGFIESIVGDTSLEDAELCAFARSRPDWKVTRDKGTGKNAGTAGAYTASKREGKFETRVSAHTLTHLHFRTAP